MVVVCTFISWPFIRVTKAGDLAIEYATLLQMQPFVSFEIAYTVYSSSIDLTKEHRLLDKPPLYLRAWARGLLAHQDK